MLRKEVSVTSRLSPSGARLMVENSSIEVLKARVAAALKLPFVNEVRP